MSRSWPEFIQIALAPYRVTLLRRRRGSRRIHTRAALPVPDSTWQAALETLARALPPLGRGSLAEGVISSHWVRYALLPWSPAIVSSLELSAYAREHFVAVHGERARQWMVSATFQGFGRPSLASALDTPFHTDLVQVLQTRGIRLNRLVPHLSAAWRFCRRRLPAGAWLVLPEPGRVTLALADARGLARLTSQGVANGVCFESIAALIEREERLAGREPARPPLHVLAEAGSITPTVPGWPIEFIPVPEHHPAHGLAWN